MKDQILPQWAYAEILGHYADVYYSEEILNKKSKSVQSLINDIKHWRGKDITEDQIMKQYEVRKIKE